MNNLPERKNIRLKDYDYSSNGVYFVTICTHRNRPNIKKYKEKVKKTLLSLTERFNGLKVDYYVLMPTHVHIILIFEDVGITLGQIVRTFKALVTKNTNGFDKSNPYWQRNYYEHVIRNERALYKIREYIKNNPLMKRIEFEQFYESGLMNQTPTDMKHTDMK